MYDGHIGVVFMDYLVHSVAVMLIKLLCVSVYLIGVVYVYTALLHCLATTVAIAGSGRDYVEKDTVEASLKFNHDLLDLSAKGVKIGRAEAKSMITRHVEGETLTVYISYNVILMSFCVFFVKACGNVYLRAYSKLLTDFELSAEEVEIKMGMHLICLCGMI